MWCGRQASDDFPFLFFVSIPLQTKVDKELRTEQDVAASLELQMEQVHSAQEQVRRSLLDLEKRSAAKAGVSDAERKAQRQKLEVDD